MSFLTDIAVITSGEDEAVAAVNRWLAENTECGQQLCRTDLDEAGAGGCKVTSLVVYAACFNYLDFGGFEDAVRAAPWRLPRSVVVYVDGEADPDTFVFSPAREGRWEARQPPGDGEGGNGGWHYAVRVNSRGRPDPESGPDGPMTLEEALARQTWPDPGSGWRTIALRAIKDGEDYCNVCENFPCLGNHPPGGDA